MKVGRDQALVLFRVWREDRSLLRCVFLLGAFAASLRARVIDVTDELVTLLSDDTFSEVALPLTSGLEFTYGNPGRSREEGIIWERTVVVSFPSPSPGVERARVVFLEVVGTGR